MTEETNEVIVPATEPEEIKEGEETEEVLPPTDDDADEEDAE